MREDQKALLRETFALIAPDAEAVAAIFYRRLFELDPALRPLFKSDMTAQGHKLMAMIGMVIANLDRLEAVVPAVRELGKRHAGYGVVVAHYGTMSGALFWMLRQALGDAWTQETAAAWATCYGLIVGMMLAGSGQGGTMSLLA